MSATDALDERSRDLAAANLNGLRLVLVTLQPAGAPTHAVLTVQFFNSVRVAQPVNSLLASITANPALATTLFPISGGHRVRGGPGSGQVKVTAVAAGGAPDTLRLTVAPIGDYSTYTLACQESFIDPVFGEIGFKFRPGCFSNDCSPAWAPAPAPLASPAIDYLAKDYDSFRHTLMTAMAQRVPGWASTSEADLDQTLIDLFAATADELSDYQDRVMNEAYLASCRSRVSLARHARLVDYHIHQGNQSSAWLALTVNNSFANYTLPADFTFWSGRPPGEADCQLFATRSPQRVDPLLNTLRLHTWSDARPSLAAGSTSADLIPDSAAPNQADANAVRDLIGQGVVKNLLLQEWLNPLTGREPGRNPEKRQLLRLHDFTADPALRPVTLRDPLTNQWFVRIHWREEDALRADYCFTVWTGTPTTRVPNISRFHGNLVRVYHGIPAETFFYEPGVELPIDDPQTPWTKHRHFERLVRYGEDRGTLCRLPPEHAPLAYLPTPVGGEIPPESTLRATVTASAITSSWDEVISLVHSREDDEHCAVETDELQRSFVRFGDGLNGRQLAAGTVAHCRYQIGGGIAGNVGTDSIRGFPTPLLPTHPLTGAWNPFDVTDGRDPEPVAKILRAAPEAFRARQLRAITLPDYIARAEEVDGVSRAVARYAWTGSWRTVRIVIDPVGTTTLRPALRDAVSEHLEALRLIGEDLEIRPPRYVPLSIVVRACVREDVWREDVQAFLEQEFSDGWTPDGRRGFFHPDAWTFGQALHRSEIAGRVHAVAGIEHILSIEMERFNEPTPGTPQPEVMEMAFDEIVQVLNDVDHLEKGRITFDLRGGRQ
jgi:hypothetical protein